MVQSSDESESLLTGYSGRMFVVITVGFLAVKIGQRLFPPLLPVIIDDLAITPFTAGVALSIMSVARALMQYPSGRYSDRLSRKTLLVISLGLLLVGLVILVNTVTYVLLLVGVTIYGISSGLYDPADRALLSDLFQQRRGQAFGVHMMAGDLAGIFAAGLTVIVIGIASWHAAFLPSIVLVIPVLVLIYWWNREPIMLTRVDLEIRQTGTRLFGASRMRWLLIAYVLFVFGSKGITSFLPTFLSTDHQFSFAFASLAFAMLYAVGIGVKPIAGTLSDRMSRPIIASSGLLVGGVGLALLILAPSQPLAIVGVFVYAVGQRSFPPPMQAYFMDLFPDTNMGGDLGAVRAFYMGLGSLGPAYVGFVASELSYFAAYATIVFCFLIATGLILWTTLSD